MSIVLPDSVQTDSLIDPRGEATPGRPLNSAHNGPQVLLGVTSLEPSRLRDGITTIPQGRTQFDPLSPDAGEAACAMSDTGTDTGTETDTGIQIRKRATNAALQAKLDALVVLGSAGDREAFVRAFVPLDLSEADLQGFLGDILNNAEQWSSLVAEIRAIADGAAVKRIGGDQVSRATFFFQSPTAELCDREVVFTCVDGEWRAEG